MHVLIALVTALGLWLTPVAPRVHTDGPHRVAAPHGGTVPQPSDFPVAQGHQERKGK